MLKDIRDNFRSILNIILYLILIASGIYGIYYGVTIGQLKLSFIEEDNTRLFLGALLYGTLNLVLGYLFIVLFFGTITTLLNIDENVQKMTKVITDLAENKKLPPDSNTAETNNTVDYTNVESNPDLNAVNSELGESNKDLTKDDLKVGFAGFIEEVSQGFAGFIKEVAEGLAEEPQPHKSAITAWGKTFPVKGDAQIPADDFNAAKGKLESAMAGLKVGISSLNKQAKFVKMLNSAGFAFIVETGTAGPAADAHKSMTIGIDFLLANDAQPTIAIAIRDKVCTDNAFA